MKTWFLKLVSVPLLVLAVAQGCKEKKQEVAAFTGPGKALFEGKGCLGCHGFGGGDKPTGPDLLGVTQRRSKEWLTKWIKDPAQMLKTDKDAQALLKKFNNVPMPGLGLSEQESADIVAYLAWMTETGGGNKAPFVPLTQAEFDQGKEIFFNRCSGCHGAQRWGATGPSLLPDSHIVASKEVKGGGTRSKGTEALEAILYNGTPAGMPPWGKEGILSKEQINLMARFVQMTPPKIPSLDINEMKNRWKLHVPVADRPKTDESNGRFKNYFGVVLRDAGKVAILDGDTKEKLAIIDTGFAVHILRSSHSGRYFYSIGRDGKVTLIDLWYKTPKMVAEGRTCWDARSIDSSKSHGFEDKYAIIGCYTPSQYAIMDGQTLEPISVTDVGTAKDHATGNPLPEVRVASIVASDKEPFWVINLKEAGWVYLVDYTDPKKPKETKLRADNFLHDGGWVRLPGSDELRYFLVAANGKNRVCVVDVKLKKVQQPCIQTDKVPHPGRGANFVHPKYGPVWATPHIGAATMSFIGVDPVKYPQYAWKEVERVKIKSAGSLFVKSHPKSGNLWFDMPLSSVEGANGELGVYDIKTGQIKYIKASPKRITHMEYNAQGTEVWVSGWLEGTILVYDDKTTNLVKTIKESWVQTPTGKFNVTNTSKDIY